MTPNLLTYAAVLGKLYAGSMEDGKLRRATAMGNLIQCGDHKWAPWSVVCVHLLADPKLKWVDGEALPGQQPDYLCPACAAQLPKVPIDNLKAICIHCVRRIRDAVKS